MRSIRQHNNLSGCKVRVGFAASDRYGNGKFKVTILNKYGEEIDSGSSGRSKENYYADTAAALDAAQAVSERFNIPLDVNGFERFDDSFGTIDTARVNSREGTEWGAVIGVTVLIVLIVLGGGWLIANLINGTSTLL